MKATVDSSFLISLSLTCHLHLIDILAKKVEFYIGRKVYFETVDKPIRKNKYKLQAVRILELIDKGKLKLYDIDEEETREIMEIANSIFYSKKRRIEIVHWGECEAVALARKIGAKIIFIDEKTMRLLIEAPEKLKEIMESKLHRKIEINKKKLEEWREIVDGIYVERSADLLVYVLRKGLVNPLYKKEYLDGVLWALRMAGCSISEEEIRDYLRVIQ